MDSELVKGLLMLLRAALSPGGIMTGCTLLKSSSIGLNTLNYSWPGWFVQVAPILYLYIIILYLLMIFKIVNNNCQQLFNHYMQQDESIGAIRVPRMIWTATVLSLGAIYYCWATCGKEDPSIMTSALQYPSTIVLRVGLMYSLFILFLVSFFIKWWLESSQKAEHTKKALVTGLICLASYGLFVSTIDRKRINYQLAEWAVFVASVTNFITISIIHKNIRAIRQTDPHFISEKSYRFKSLFYNLFAGLMLSGLMIYTGLLDIDYKNKIQYGIVTATYMFYWSFSLDFKGFTMDIDKFVTKQQIKN